VDKPCFLNYHNKANPCNFSGCATGPPYIKLGPQLEMQGKEIQSFKNSFLFRQ
jgi:hypothetical protein